jgi:hypothetical protein
MKWEENIELRDLVIKLKNSARDKEFWKKFIEQVANHEEFAGLLIFALESELQDRHWRNTHGRNVGKET